MKTNILFILLIISGGLFSQTVTENYIQTRTYLEPVTTTSATAKQMQSIQYFDGLGRPKQTVDVKASPTKKDIVTHIEYDAFGRQAKSYLPVPQSGTQNGDIYSNPLQNVSAIYGNEKIYSEQILENSPLNRVLGQIQVGNDWQNKPINFDYDANTTTDAVKKYTTTTTWNQGVTNSTLSISGVYGNAQLYKNTTTDEDGNISIEFKNGMGQLILSRKKLDNQNIDTYYVYNEYNQQAFVIPPLAAEKTTISSTDLSELCYQYRYDGRNRIAEKKLPGKGWESFVYDQQDRLVLSQDANLITTSNNFNKRGWLFTKYDQFGRVVYTGFFTNSATREAMQKALDNMRVNPGNNEKRTTTAFTLNGLAVYYTQEAFPRSSITLLSINYYDDYPAGSPDIPTNILGQTTLKPQTANSKTSTKSLPTASMIKNIENDRWTKIYTYYDTKARAIGTLSQNHLGGYTKTESLLEFSGVAKQTKTYHKRTATDTEIILNEGFTYDHQNRLLAHKHQVNNEPTEILAENSYNEIGQLKNKKTGNNLQSIDYAYNIRGWLTKINNPANLGTKLFGYELKYHNPTNPTTAPKRYNGNIAEIDWATKNDNILRRYGYRYDNLNRLLVGVYQEPRATVPVNNHYNEQLTYDINGNITNLKRNQKPTAGTTAELIDNLNYQYTGNRLTKINDASRNHSGYPIGGNAITYDNNGNMTNLLDKDITDIKYNFLNLPSSVTFSDFIVESTPISTLLQYKTTNYAYRADGVKLQKKQFYFERNNSVETIDYYLDGFQYQNSVLQFVPTAEGYYDFIKKSYIYNYLDHLGNVRLSYYRNSTNIPEILEENNYYPFGLKHQGHNNAVSTNNFYNYKYQSQELQETGFYSFKWRNYMPDVGRFFNVDPLAEEFPYNGVYNFSENRVVDGIELEGLEWVPWVIRVTPLVENAAIRPNPVVETVVKTGEITGKTTQKHHIIPRQFKNNNVVKEARDQGFKFEGKENKISVEKFSKATGEGRHGSHPKYNQQIKELLKEIPKGEAVKGIRALRDKAQDAINSNPDTKINDLKLQSAPPIKMDGGLDAQKRKNEQPIMLMPKPEQKDPCAGIPNCT
ncbi:MAG: DUF6443 domain-containing protein [Cruoricaptor ignavus]|nr:DUF6443 domain-containing protein [Cruoricaptor ignavus]